MTRTMPKIPTILVYEKMAIGIDSEEELELYAPLLNNGATVVKKCWVADSVRNALISDKIPQQPVYDYVTRNIGVDITGRVRGRLTWTGLTWLATNMGVSVHDLVSRRKLPAGAGAALDRSRRSSLGAVVVLQGDDGHITLLDGDAAIEYARNNAGAVLKTYEEAIKMIMRGKDRTCICEV